MRIKMLCSRERFDLRSTLDSPVTSVLGTPSLAVPMFACSNSCACLQTFIVAPNVNYKDAACTDLSALAFGDYTYLGTEPVKCTAPGEGYMFNYPANVAGAPPTVGGQYFCAKFKDYGNRVKLL